MQQLLHPFNRACYMCSESEWLPETVSHTLQLCQHHVLVAERTSMLQALGNLVASASAVNGCPTAPDINNLSSQYYLMQLATGVGPITHRGQPSELPPSTAPRRSFRLAERRASAGSTVASPLAVSESVDMNLKRQRSQWLPLQSDQVKVAATWTAFFTSAWRRAIACEREDDAAAVIGARLVELVVQFHRRMISLRRRVLQKNCAYLRRTRDPPEPVMT